MMEQNMSLLVVVIGIIFLYIIFAFEDYSKEQENEAKGEQKEEVAEQTCKQQEPSEEDYIHASEEKKQKPKPRTFNKKREKKKQQEVPKPRQPKSRQKPKQKPKRKKNETDAIITKHYIDVEIIEKKKKSYIDNLKIVERPKVNISRRGLKKVVKPKEEKVNPLLREVEQVKKAFENTKIGKSKITVKPHFVERLNQREKRGLLDKYTEIELINEIRTAKFASTHYSTRFKKFQTRFRIYKDGVVYALGADIDTLGNITVNTFLTAAHIASERRDNGVQNELYKLC